MFEQFKSKPSPVDAMVRDFPVSEIHDFQNIHLFSVRHLSWVFPDETMPVPKERSIAIPADKFIWASPDSLFKEAPDLCTTEDTAPRIIKNSHG